MASRVTSVRHGRRPGKPCPTRARSLAMPSSVMRPCSVSAMGPPWAGPRARPEQPDDRLFEEAALDGERARREKVVAPAGQPAERRGVGEVGEDHAEEGDAQVRDLLRLPAGVARRLAHHRDALAVERADPALEERLHRGRLLEQRALQQARQMRVAGQVRGQPIERRMHALGLEAVLPRDHVDDRRETALEDGVARGGARMEVLPPENGRLPGPRRPSITKRIVFGTLIPAGFAAGLFWLGMDRIIPNTVIAGFAVIWAAALLSLIAFGEPLKG